MAKSTPDEIKICNVHDTKVFCDAIGLSGLTEDRAILYSKSEFEKNYTSATMDCYSQGANDSLTRGGVDGYRFVGNIRNPNPNCLYSRYIITETFRPEPNHVPIDYDRDPILIPVLNGGKLASTGYREFHGANVSGWDYKTISQDKLKPISSLGTDDSFDVSAISCAVPELSGIFLDAMRVLEDEMRRGHVPPPKP